jgi:hypothetical protein
MDTNNIDNKLEVPVLVWSHDKNKTEDLPASLGNNPLFKKSRKSGLLESNFDCDLHRVLVEVTYWTKIQTLGFITIPHNVARLM